MLYYHVQCILKEERRDSMYLSASALFILIYIYICIRVLSLGKINSENYENY